MRLSNPLVLLDAGQGNRIWGPVSPDKPPITQSLVIIDWDDTLVPTTWLVKRGIRPDKEVVLSSGRLEYFEELSKAIELLILKAKAYGKVVIITNSADGWVQEFAGRYMPSLLKVLEGVQVCSARSIYENCLGNIPLMWKVHAFRYQLYSTFGPSPSVVKNVLSLGDSLHERAALRTLKGENTYAKNIKFMDTPTPELVLKQLGFIAHFMQHLVEHKADLDLMIDLRRESKDIMRPIESPGYPPDA